MGKGRKVRGSDGTMAGASMAALGAVRDGTGANGALWKMRPV